MKKKSDDEDVKSKKKKKKSSEKEEKPAKKKKKSSGVELDGWGNRTPTRTSRINSVLMKAKKPLSVAEIEEKAKCSSIHSHLSKLKGLKLIKKTDDNKFVATKEGAKKAD